MARKKMKGMRRLNNKEKQILIEFIKHRPSKNPDFKNNEIRDLIPRLKKVNGGYERSIESTRNSLKALFWEGFLPTGERKMSEERAIIQKTLNQTGKKIYRLFYRILSQRLSNKDKDLEALKKRLGQLQKENEGLKDQLRDLREVQAAIAKFQKKYLS